MPKKDYTNYNKKELTERIHALEKRKKYGLVWDEEKTKERFEKDVEGKLPVLVNVKENEIRNDENKPIHILIEGDNYHALSVLNYTHKKAIDVIYIDPPYNTGEDEFKFNDKYVNEEDGYRHSKWLSFMERRLKLAKNLLNDTGIIIIHIDEHELDRLYLLLDEIFQEKNDLGRIIWDKRNPKGDSKGVSILNETILCFAKNREEFLKLPGVLTRPKPNAQKILDKAKKLYDKIGKSEIPEEIIEVVKPFNLKKETLEKLKVTYDIELVNREFKNWIEKQGFSGGEKAYKIIDGDGNVYRGVSMAWPNKNKAPDDYFIPLVHPITAKPCPIPKRGWRNPPATMEKLLELDLILFGKDENKQPERKYVLKDNMNENVPSIFSYGGSDESFFTEIGVQFPYAKPVNVGKYLLSAIHPKPEIVLDFFAGSGTALHAVADLNLEDNKRRQTILVTNNENSICDEITLPRLKKILNGYGKQNGSSFKGYKESLKFFRTAFVPAQPTDKNKELLTKQSVEMLCLRENTFDFVKETEIWKLYRSKQRHTGILFDQTQIPAFKKELLKLDMAVSVYVFSLGDDDFAEDFSEMKNVKVCSIPEAILRVYRKIFK